MVAAAIVGAAVVTAGAGAVASSSAAKSAANSSKAAAAQSAAAQNQININSIPFIQAGQGAAIQLQELNQGGWTQGQPNYLDLANASLPTSVPTLPARMTQAQLEQTPGYQFQLQQGLMATQNAAAARGLGVSGAALKGAAGYATGLANSNYQTQFANQQTLFGDQQQLFNNQQTKHQDYLNLNSSQQANVQNLYSRLAGTATLGGNVTIGAGTNAVNAATASGNFLSAAGNAQAAGAVGAGNAIAGGVNNAANSFLGQNALNQLTGNNGGSIFGSGSSGTNTTQINPVDGRPFQTSSNPDLNF